MKAFINDIASFLPNGPVENEQMEGLLGVVDRLPSRTRKIILRNNGISRRYYAIDPVTGDMTHSNAQLTAEAVKRLRSDGGARLEKLDLLCCGTSSPDQFNPGHASMVHGELGGDDELGIGPLEVISTAGICLAGITALKYAALAVTAGTARLGVATGSELVSSYLRPAICRRIGEDRAEELEKTPLISFEADFLRWMLSDGAGACLVAAEPAADHPSLRIDWIETASQAHRLETCMYAGAIKQEDGSLKGWRSFSSYAEAGAAEAFAVKQDARLLNREIIAVLVNATLQPLIAKYDLRPERITWFLPHYSSDYFRLPLFEAMQKIGFPMALDRWFTNLASKGNTGAASIYIMLAELFHSGRLRRGDTILCLIPESGRFSCGYMHLTVV
jgi:3-oxoacyl-[acyl-carrier-protein] synthase III